MTNFIRTAILGVALATSSAALADGAPPPSEGQPGPFEKVRQACQDDLARLCKDVKPGEGRIRACLREHKDEISDGCKLAIRDARAHHHPRPDRN